MRTITISHNCMKHIITIKDKKVTVFNTHFQEVVSLTIFDKYIVSRDFTGVVDSEQVFLAAERKRSAKNAKLFIGNSMCWTQGCFEIQGWKN
ncbi:hypothetical protein [Chimaeribacter arupi]|uniref:hypothetical protein n=1 Tax=Chimaeribacter arupi TaxID=2060066 RepID=UPI00294713DC|nr:hypothetical protein [Chimaeribacter arupi]MDV5140827.1 hypothetical protein [Chimaeribacter arupi]